MFLARSALVLVAVLAAGCPKDPPDDPCQLGFVGDKTAQPSIEIIYLYADGTVRPAAEGGEAPLIEPPQGGRVIFAGIRARNVDACAATLSGALRDTQSNRVMLDQRTTNLVAQDGGTAGSTGDEASTFAPLEQLCLSPQCGFSSTVHGNDIAVEAQRAKLRLVVDVAREVWG